MQSDGILINRVWQPLHILSWPGAAKEFFESKNDFLRVERNMTAGRWSPICFLFHGFVDRQLTCLSDADKVRICEKVKQFRLIEDVSDVEEAFKADLEHPPFSLVDDWRGMSDARTAWARYVYDNEPRLRP